MTELSTTATAEILTGLGDVKAGLTTIAGDLRLHGEILLRIVQLLTPSEERSGAPLHELLAALIARLDRQSVMLKEILESQGALRRNLPADVAQAIDTTRSAPGAAPNGATGGEADGANGHDQGHLP